VVLLVVISRYTPVCMDFDTLQHVVVGHSLLPYNIEHLSSDDWRRGGKISVLGTTVVHSHKHTHVSIFTCKQAPVGLG